jgi:uncharacterized membrane protein YfcA
MPYDPWEMPLGIVLLLAPLFALVAVVYAMVGLGGGTGYLALMTLFGVPHQHMPSTALSLNILVTGAAMIRFGLAGRMRWSLLAPFLVGAVPASFLGGLLDLPKRTYLGLLAVGLAVVAAAMIRSAARPDDESRRPVPVVLWAVALPAGAAFGLASGMLGIGGGIFLGPFVLLLRWAETRETAAMTSTFILVTSVIGLAAHGARGVVEPGLVVPLGAAVVIGGLIGAHLAETRLDATTLKRIFAVIIVVASLKAGLGALGLM